MANYACKYVLNQSTSYFLEYSEIQALLQILIWAGRQKNTILFSFFTDEYFVRKIAFHRPSYFLIGFDTLYELCDS